MTDNQKIALLKKRYGNLSDIRFLELDNIQREFHVMIMKRQKKRRKR